MICFPLDDTEYEAKEMGAYLATRTRGVFSAEDNLRVSPGQSGLTVTVAPGLAWLKRSDWWGVAALQDTALTFTLDKADGALSRMDAIVARLDKVGNRAEIAVKKGSFSSSPTVADPVRDDSADEIYLATVLVEPGAVSLTAAAITDQRLNESYCGLMRDGVTGIPTAALQSQVQQLIDELRRVISGIEAGSEMMLKAAYDTDGNGRVDDADKLAGKTLAQIVPKYTAAETAMPYVWLDGKTVYRQCLELAVSDFDQSTTEQFYPDYAGTITETSTTQLNSKTVVDYAGTITETSTTQLNSKTVVLNGAALILPTSCATSLSSDGQSIRPISNTRPGGQGYELGWRFDKSGAGWKISVDIGRFQSSQFSKFLFVIYYTK